VKKVGLVITLLCWIASVALGQVGNFYLTHFQHNIDNIDNQNYAIIQDTLGVIYSANRKGLLRFNGSNWELIPTISSVYSIDLARETNTLFVGIKNDFGYIYRLPTGKEVFQSLSDTIYTNVNFDKTIVWENHVYFFGSGALIKYNIAEKKIEQKWQVVDKKEITALFLAEKKIFIEVADRGVYLMEDNQFKRLYAQLPNKDKIISARELPDDQGIIIITLSGKLYRFYANTFLPFGIDETEYLEKSQALDVLVLDQELMLFSTLRGGCVIVNYQEGKVVQFVNYQSGLPDEEILAIAKDRSKGIWIAHRYGLSRIDYGLPLRDFSQFGGLEGHILAVQSFQNILYVATSTGVFYLDEIKKYEETTEKVSVLVKTNKGKTAAKKNLTSSTSATTTSESTIKKDSLPKIVVDKVVTPPSKEENTASTTVSDEDKNGEVAENSEKKKKGLLGRIGSIFKKKEKQEETTPTVKSEEAKITTTPVQEETISKEEFNTQLQENTQETEVVNPNVSAKKNTNKSKISYRKQYIEKKFIDLKSVRHLFKRVEGIEGKCDRFITVGKSLLVSGSAGLFLIGDKKEEPVEQPKSKKKKKVVIGKKESKIENKTKNKKAIMLSDEPILYAVKAAKKNIVYATTDEGRLVWLNMTDKKVRNLVKFNDEVKRIVEDAKGSLWVCGSDFIYKVDIKKSKPKVTPFEVENEYNDQIIPLKAYGRTYFILSSAAYYFNEQKTELVKDSIMIGQINHKAEFISYDDKLLWTNYKNQWNFFGEKPFNKENLVLFKLLNNIEGIIPDQDGKHFWLIAQGNSLFRFDASNPFLFSQHYGLLLNYIKNKKGNLLPIQNKFNIDYYNNSLSFSLTTPDYLKGGMVEYQYMLEGNISDGNNNAWSEWTSNGNFIFPMLGSGKYTLRVRSRNVFGNVMEAEPFIFQVRPPYWQTFWFNAIEVGFFVMLLLAAGIINRYLKHENRLLAIGKRIITMLTLVVCMEFLQTIVQNYIDINGSPVKDFVVEVFLALMLLPLEWILMKIITAQFKKKKIKTLPHSSSTVSNIQPT
jgi:hypothetical protein